MRNNAGFTLLEVLLAMALTSLVMASLYGIFSATSDAKERVEKQGAALHLGRVLIARLDRELLGLSLETGSPFAVLAGGKNSLGEPSIEFLTNSSGASTPGASRVTYRLGRDTDQQLVLWRSETGQYSQDAVHEERLAHGLEELSFTFFDGRRWRESWDSRSDLRPLLVRAEMKLKTATGQPPLVSVFNLPQSVGTP